MTRATQPAPEAVLQAANEARRYVQQALAFALDDTPETLSVLDHYLKDVSGQAPEIVALVAVAAGCYFGELVRLRYGASWEGAGDDPLHWRLQIPKVELSFSPVAVAQQAIARGANAAYDDSFQVPDDVRGPLAEALQRLPALPEDVYYTLANRWDTLETVMDVLVSIGKDAAVK